MVPSPTRGQGTWVDRNILLSGPKLGTIVGNNGGSVEFIECHNECKIVLNLRFLNLRIKTSGTQNLVLTGFYLQLMRIGVHYCFNLHLEVCANTPLVNTG